jgi:rubredoxin
MARFRCRVCGQEGEFIYDPEHHACPVCGSSDVVFALPMDELPDELFDALAKAEPLNDETDED